MKDSKKGKPIFNYALKDARPVGFYIVDDPLRQSIMVLDGEIIPHGYYIPIDKVEEIYDKCIHSYERHLDLKNILPKEEVLWAQIMKSPRMLFGQSTMYY